jgi:hypothetical protein
MKRLLACLVILGASLLLAQPSRATLPPPCNQVCCSGASDGDGCFYWSSSYGPQATTCYSWRWDGGICDI